MADHVGFMLNTPGAEEHSVTLLHCREPVQEPGREPGVGSWREPDGEGAAALPAGEAAIVPARQAILANGVDEARVRVPVPRVGGKDDKAATILRLAERDRCAVVAVGRRTALPDTLMRRMFGRSVGERLHDRVSRFSLWVGK